MFKRLPILFDADGAPGAPPEPAPAPVEPTATPAAEPPAEPSPEPEKTVPLKALEDERRKRKQEQELRHQIELEAAELRGRMSAAAPVQPVNDGPPLEPAMEQFQDGEGNVDYDAFEKAQKRHIVDLAKYELKKEVDTIRTQEVQKQTAAQVEANWVKQIEGAKVKYPDFLDVVGSPDFRQTDAVAQVIKQSAMGADVAYYLATHLNDANRLNTLNPLQVAMEVGRIEAKLSNTPAPAPPPRISAAPPPASEVPAGGQPQSFDPETATMADYYNHRQRQTGYIK